MSTTETRDETRKLIERMTDLRRRMGMSQAEFADKFGMSVMTFKHWETGNRTPDTAAQTLIAMIITDPDTTGAIIDRYRWQQEREQLTAA